MKRVTTILATALLASSLLTAAEARGGGGGGDFGGADRMAGFGGGAHIGGIGLDFHHYAMHHFGRFSPGYGVHDSYDPNCHKEATRGDEFPCFHE